MQFIAVLGAYIAVFSAPVIFMGLKHGPRWALATAGFSIAWLILGALIGSLIFGGEGADTPPIEPLDLMDMR